MTRIERRDVERNDRAVAAFGQPIDQAMTDLAAGPGDDNDGFAHLTGRHVIAERRSSRGRARPGWRAVASRQIAAATK